MTANPLERWDEIEPILERALDLPAAERRAYIEQACADDTELRQAVERLLAPDRDVSAFLERPPAADALRLLSALAGDPAAPEPADGALANRQVGHYRLLSELGSGGMSDVYLAERVDEFKQRVAVKVMRPTGGLREERELRFQAERQLLASLEHPNIARILDGGTLDDGRHYLAMELVEGLPLDRHCQARSLDLDARLRLFGQVCAAVHYAHQRLIVHRDLKPSNVLVDAEGHPKLLDFGIAKRLDEAPGGYPDAPRTRTGLLLMTPEYAAPEQVLGQPVTTATDVYALGVILYELIAGCRPYSLSNRTPSEIEQIVCHTTPVDPSRARAGVTGLAPMKVPQDLDSIVHKALAKEPARRYGSAAELAEDIDRLLTGHPVRARPATRGYRVARFVRRHRWGVSVAAGAALLLVGFAAVLAVQYRQTLIERNRAEAEAVRATEEAARAGAVTSFLVDLFAASDPNESLGEAVTARELLDRGRAQIDAFAGPPVAKAAIQDAIGAAYKGLGMLDESEVLLESALAFQQRAAPGSLALAAAAERLATLRMDQGRWAEAETLMQTVLAVRQELLPGDDPLVAEAHYHQGIALRLVGRLEDAEASFRESLRLQRSASPVDIDAVEKSLGSLGIALGQQGRLDESEETFREALRLAQENRPPGHPGILTALNNLAVVLGRQGKREEAVVIDREVVEHRRRVLGPRHPQTSASLSNLGQKLLALNRLDEAEGVIAEALDIERELYEQGSPSLAISFSNMGWLRRLQGSFDEALAYHRSALEMRRELLGENHPHFAISLRHLGWVLRDAGELEQARPLLEQALDIQTRVLGSDHPRVGESMDLLGVLEFRAGNLERARTLLEQALAISEAKLPADHPDLAATREHLAELNAAALR